VHLADLRRSMVQEWVAGLVRSGLAPATVRVNLATLRACFSAAVVDGLMSANPAAKVDLPRVLNTEQRFLSILEVQRLCEAVEPRYRSMVDVGVACGLRIGELVALQAGDVDFLRRAVTVRRTALRRQRPERAGQVPPR
jgi:site-specific recombinase XerD